MRPAPHDVHRVVLIAVILTVTGLLAYAYYTQFVEYLIPCPLCLTQRFFYILVGIFALLAVFRLRVVVWQKVLSVLILLASLGGLATAGRQIWLQHLPPEKVPECGPGLEFWLQNMPFLRTLELLFKGDGNCAEVDWLFLGLSMADWSFGFFLVLFGTGVWLFACRPRLTRF